MRGRTTDVWPPYIWVALALALTSGFGFGAGLYAARAVGLPADAWWPALAQAHGHSQLFGFVGLLVVGTLLHFLPRLRGAPLWRPGGASAALGFYGAGLLTRIVAQFAVALGLAPGRPWRAALALSGVLELLGGFLALALLVATVWRGPALARRPGFREVVPFLAVAGVGYAVALALNAAGAVVASVSPRGLVPYALDRWAVRTMLYATLIPVAVAMSGRLFPLYFRTPRARQGQLRAGLVLLLAGLVAGGPGLPPTWVPLASLARALAFVLLVSGTAIFASRQPLPRGQPLPRDAVWYHALSASGWLVVSAALLFSDSLAAVGIRRVWLPAGLETHLLGTGYLTMLILGVGAKLLPGFARRPLRREALVWFTLVTGNAATLLRALPLLLPGSLSGATRGGLLSLAGLLGVAALGALAWNLSAGASKAGHRAAPMR